MATDSLSNTPIPTDESPPSHPLQKICIICTNEACEKIDRDQNFNMMLDLYWKGVKAVDVEDIKPQMNKDFFLCLDCYDMIVQFYHANEVIVYFEAKMEQLRRNLLRTNLKGIVSSVEKGIKLLDFQTAIIKEHGTKLEPGEDESINAMLDQYQIENYRTDIESESAPVAVGETPTTGTSNKRKQSPRKPKSKRRRKVRLAGRNSESEQSDGSNFSDEEDIHDIGPVIAERRSERSARRAAVVIDTNQNSDDNDNEKDQDKECKICLDTFQSSSGYVKHLRQHRVGEEGSKYQYECRHCFQPFHRQARLVEHKKTCTAAAGNNATTD